MLPGVVLLDNDVVIKLAQYELLDELLVALDVTFKEIFVLKELQYVAYLGDVQKGIEFFGSSNSFEKARTFFHSSNLAEIKSIKIMQFILSLERPGLDIGELVLLGCLLEDEKAFLITGDKRALPHIDNAIVRGEFSLRAGRFITLEIALLLIIRKSAFQYISDKVRSRPHVDNALASCFGRSAPADCSSTVAGLTSYIESLRTQLSSNLLVRV